MSDVITIFLQIEQKSKMENISVKNFSFATHSSKEIGGEDKIVHLQPKFGCQNTTPKIG